MKIEVFPGPGTMIRLDGQKYELIRVGFYQNGEGEVREVAYWRSSCAEPGCREPIEVFAPLGSLMLSRRCAAHAKPGVWVTPKPKPKRGRPRRLMDGGRPC